METITLEDMLLHYLGLIRRTGMHTSDMYRRLDNIERLIREGWDTKTAEAFLEKITAIKQQTQEITVHTKQAEEKIKELQEVL